jgi:NAD(P)-dependent dehydrogenase (short-subunit alcohol dehydrogenase family)
MGNGRATVLRFAEEGAKVLAIDNDLASVEETVVMARRSVENAPHSQRM